MKPQTKAVRSAHMEGTPPQVPSKLPNNPSLHDWICSSTTTFQSKSLKQTPTTY